VANKRGGKITLEKAKETRVALKAKKRKLDKDRAASKSDKEEMAMYKESMRKVDTHTHTHTQRKHAQFHRYIEKHTCKHTCTLTHVHTQNRVEKKTISFAGTHGVKDTIFDSAKSPSGNTQALIFLPQTQFSPAHTSYRDHTYAGQGEC
jgi:DUF438 domain-containing protein